MKRMSFQAQTRVAFFLHCSKNEFKHRLLPHKPAIKPKVPNCIVVVTSILPQFSCSSLPPPPLQLTIKCKLQPLKKKRKVSDEAVFKPLHSPGVKPGNID